MSEKLYKEDFLLGVTLFLCSLGLLIMGLVGQGWPEPFGYNLFAVFLVSGVSGFFSLVFSIKAVL